MSRISISNKTGMDCVADHEASMGNAMCDMFHFNYPIGILLQLCGSNIRQGNQNKGDRVHPNATVRKSGNFLW
jgi:hypothetical protein